MASRNTATAIKAGLLERTQALGNSNRGLKEVCSDLCNQFDRRHAGKIAEGCFLSKGTVVRVMECEPHYRPQADTLERILRYFNAQIQFSEVVIKPRYRNHEKE